MSTEQAITMPNAYWYERALVVIDPQNDFAHPCGSLAVDGALEVINTINDYLKQFDNQGGIIVFTMDTHFSNYLNTSEGRELPVEHCTRGSWGWGINADLAWAVSRKGTSVITKSTFGAFAIGEALTKAREIYIVGFCTDICVVSNALILKSMFPEARIVVLENGCAGTTKERHEAALEVMRSCQIEIRSDIDE